jgi:hypothetical protein
LHKNQRAERRKEKLISQAESSCFVILRKLKERFLPLNKNLKNRESALSSSERMLVDVA